MSDVCPGLFGVQKERMPTDGFARPPMSQEKFIDDLGVLLERRIPLLFAFTGEQNWAFSHADQFHDMVRPLETRGRVDVAIYPRADHTFSIPDDRRDFVDAMTRWFSEAFPLAEPQRVSTLPPVSVPEPMSVPAPMSMPAPMSGVRAVGEEEEPTAAPRKPHIRLVS